MYGDSERHTARKPSRKCCLSTSCSDKRIKMRRRCQSSNHPHAPTPAMYMMYTPMTTGRGKPALPNAKGKLRPGRRPLAHKAHIQPIPGPIMQESLLRRHKTTQSIPCLTAPGQSCSRQQGLTDKSSTLPQVHRKGRGHEGKPQ